MAEKTLSARINENAKAIAALEKEINQLRKQKVSLRDEALALEQERMESEAAKRLAENAQDGQANGATVSAASSR